MRFYDTGPIAASFLLTMNSSPWSTHSYSHGQWVLTVRARAISTVQGTDPNGAVVNDRTATLVISSYTKILPPAYYMT